MRIGFDSIFAMKVLNCFFLLVSALLTYQIAIKINKGNKIFALVIALLLLLNSNVLEYSSILMSEMSFLLVLLLTIYFFILSDEREFSLKSSYTFLFLISLVLLIYVRNQGIVFLIAVVFYLLLKKRYLMTIVCFSFVFICLLPWQIRSNNLGGNSYTKQLMKVNPYLPNSPKMELGNWAERVKKNFIRYTSKEIPKIVVPSLKVKYTNRETKLPYKMPWFFWLIGISTIIFVIIGIWQNIAYRYFFLFLFAGTTSIHLLWPEVWFGTRFILPMTPLIFLFLIVGVFKSLEYLLLKNPNIQEWKFAFLPFLIFAFFTVEPTNLLHLKAESELPKNYDNFLKLGKWTNENLTDKSVVCSRKPGLFYMTNKNKSIGFPYTADQKELYDYFDKNKVTHVVLEQLGYNQTRKFLSPLIGKGQDKFKLVHSIDIGKVKKKNEKGEIVDAINPHGVWLFEYLPAKGFQGGYVNGLREGEGTYYFQNGNVFKGNWKQDTINGPGELQIGEGETLIGNWKNNKKNGKFYFLKNKKWFECYYVQDSIQRDGYLVDEKRNRIQKLRFK